MGFTSSRDPFVGPVYDLSSSIKEELVGQYISAGYTGHGMPRAFGWSVFSFFHLLLPINLLMQYLVMVSFRFRDLQNIAQKPSRL